MRDKYKQLPTFHADIRNTSTAKSPKLGDDKKMIQYQQQCIYIAKHSYYTATKDVLNKQKLSFSYHFLAISKMSTKYHKNCTKDPNELEDPTRKQPDEQLTRKLKPLTTKVRNLHDELFEF